MNHQDAQSFSLGRRLSRPNCYFTRVKGLKSIAMSSRLPTSTKKLEINQNIQNGGLSVCDSVNISKYNFLDQIAFKPKYNCLWDTTQTHWIKYRNIGYFSFSAGFWMFCLQLRIEWGERQSSKCPHLLKLWAIRKQNKPSLMCLGYFQKYSYA